MDDQTLKRLAGSLTAESSDIVPYLPYLLQDLWELGSNATDMQHLLQQHAPLFPPPRILDLACGKGAVSIQLCKTLGASAVGCDILGDFIAEAKQKAQEYGVAGNVTFYQADVKEALKRFNGFDIAIWGAAGPVFGDYPSTVKAVAGTVKPGGYVLLDDEYAQPEDTDCKFISDCPTEAQWQQIFHDAGLTEIARLESPADIDRLQAETQKIAARAKELSKQLPEKAELFLGYVQSQQNEVDDLTDTVIGTTWLLQRMK